MEQPIDHLLFGSCVFFFGDISGLISVFKSIISSAVRGVLF